MSGHSKWRNIQARKGKQDALRSNVFTKLAKTITLAAQSGADAATNFALRLAIEKAKIAGVPKDNIERAIKRGTGELKEGVRMEELLYEAFGPGGTAILIKVITDNKNRTLPELKKIFSQHEGSVAGIGSVQWMFEQWGVVVIKKQEGINKQEFELALIEAGAENIEDTQEGEIEIKIKPENFQSTVHKLKELSIEPVRSSIEWLAKEELSIDEDANLKLEKLFETLEAHDDVEEYYTNARSN